MAISKEKKKETVKELLALIKKQKSIVFVDTKGLDCEVLSDFRAQVKNKGGQMKIAKKTLISRSFQEQGYSVTKKDLIGQTALVFDLENETAMVKLSQEFAKKNKKFNITNGFLNYQLISQPEVELLATLPSKKILWQQFISSINHLLFRLVFVLQGNTTKLLVVLNQIKENK